MSVTGGARALDAVGGGRGGHGSGGSLRRNDGSESSAGSKCEKTRTRTLFFLFRQNHQPKILFSPFHDHPLAEQGLKPRGLPSSFPRLTRRWKKQEIPPILFFLVADLFA